MTATESAGALQARFTAVQGLGIVIGPIVGTAIYTLDVRAPYVLIGVLLIGISLAVYAGRFPSVERDVENPRTNVK